MSRDRYRFSGCSAAVAFLLLATQARAADAAGEDVPDEDFLEYLGSVESEEDNWTDLENADAAKPSATDSARSKQNGASGQRGDRVKNHESK